MDSKKIDLSGTFGMHEMEVAARIIVDKVRSKKKLEASVGSDDFAGNYSAMTGFLELIYHGWMTKFMYNGRFYPKKAFWKRIKMKVPKGYEVFK